MTRNLVASRAGQSIGFDFFDEIPMDQEHTLDQLTGRFQSVKDGLPELVKNAKDHYARLGVTERDERQIVVIANSQRELLAVLDFAGAGLKDFQGWIKWSSRTGSTRERAADIEGGHGNGGKSFMVRGSATRSFIESCANGRRTKMGFQNDDPERRYHPGYALERGIKVEDLIEPDPKSKLIVALRQLGVPFDKLSEQVRAAFHRRQAYTLVVLEEVRDWQKRQRRTLPKLLAEIEPQLRIHPQSALTVETSRVWVFVDGNSSRQPLQLQLPNPMEGFEAPVRIRVPDELMDSQNYEMVATGCGGDGKYLELRTSNRSLRMGDMKPLNVIRVRNDRNVVTNWSIADLVLRAESAFIYGQVFLPDLNEEHTVGADRNELADTALVRALRQWVVEQVEDLAVRIQKALARDHKAEDREKTNDRLVHFRELMRRFLLADPSFGDADSIADRGTTDTRGGSKKPTPPKKPHGMIINRIVLEHDAESVTLAAGTSVPLSVRCYEIRDNGERLFVPTDGIELFADEHGVIELGESRTLKAHRVGKVECWVKSADSGVESNRVLVEVVECTGADILVPDRPLFQGERLRLRVSFPTPLGPRDDLLIDGSIDESDAGTISRKCMLTAGRRESTATVRVRFGAGPSDTATQVVEIGSDSVPPPQGRGGPNGGDIPDILLCGSEAPGMEDYPSDQRTHSGGEYYPTITLCANMTETLAPLFITVEGREDRGHGKDSQGGATVSAGGRP